MNSQCDDALEFMTVFVNIQEDLWTCLSNIVAEGPLTDPGK